LVVRHWSLVGQQLFVVRGHYKRPFIFGFINKCLFIYTRRPQTRRQPNTSTHHYAGRPETIEETAELVNAAGGVGIPVRVDHTSDEVAALFTRVRREQKCLDVLVNILTGQPVASWKSFWQLPLDEGRAFVNGWLWPHIVTGWHAAPLMIERRSGLMVEIIEQDAIGYHGQFFFDLMETSLKRLSFGLAEELAPKGVTALAITPGFMRTDAVSSDPGRLPMNTGLPTSTAGGRIGDATAVSIFRSR
jgi:NAD(P)-dependent dehydrogenase (short-subunit alcohol dehydrogenase family)